MKHFFLLPTIILFHFITCSQPNIHKITWIGENNEYLSISKKKVFWQKGSEFQQFDIIKYSKNNYIILSQKEIRQKYNIAHLTNDTLILALEGTEVFKLCEQNKENQLVFTNSSISNYQFVEFYYEASFNDFNNPKNDKLKFIVYIDSAKNSRVVVKNESFNEGTMYTAPPSKVEYANLIKILSSCDISGVPCEDIEIDKESLYEMLEISYNGKIKKIMGFSSLPFNFADNLTEFICDYIELRVNINMPFGWRAIISRQ